MRKVKIVIYGSLCLMGMINFGMKFYTLEPGLLGNLPLSCIISTVVTLYFGLETLRVIGERNG